MMRANPRTMKEEATQLEEKTLQLLSVQRNYDTMSRMMQAKQREIDQLQIKYEDEQARYISLTVQLDDSQKRAQAAEAQVARLKGLPDQVTTLQMELQKLRFDTSLERGKSSTLEDRLTGLSKAAEDAEHGNFQLRRELEQSRGREASLQGQVRTMSQEAEGLKAEIKSLTGEARAMRDSLNLAKSSARQAEQRSTLLSGRLTTKDETIAGLTMNVRALQTSLDEEKAGRQMDAVSLAAARGHTGVLEGQLASTRQSLKLAVDAQTAAEVELARTSADLKEATSSLGATSDRCKQLVLLLAAAEERCDTALSQSLDVGALVSAFQVQIKQSKALLGEANDKLAAQEDAARRATLAARQRADADAARQRELQERFERQRAGHVRLCGALVQRAEAALEKLSALQTGVGQAAQDTLDRHERVMNGFMGRLHVWEQSAVEQEELMRLVDTQVAALRRLSESRSAAERRQGRDKDLVGQLQLQQQRRAEQEALQLQQKVQELEAALGNERHALVALRGVNARMEAEHEAALRAAGLLAEQRADVERQRLAARLDKLSAEVSRLERAAADAGRAGAETLRLERDQMQRQLAALRSALDAEKLRADEAERTKQAAIGGQLASLSRLHQSELDTVRTNGSARVGSLESSLATARANIMSTWDATQRLLTDMAAVAGHLVKMGWELTEVPDAAAAAAICGRAGEDGSGGALSKAALLLRLHFSYITEAVQNMPLKAAAAAAAAAIAPAPAVPAASVDLMRELRATVARLLHAEEALAPPCTCLCCLSILKQPVTCIPCGHSLCAACFAKEGVCVECGGAKGQAALPNAPLEAICSKYEYKLSALRSIQMLMQTAGIDEAKSASSDGRAKRA